MVLPVTRNRIHVHVRKGFLDLPETGSPTFSLDAHRQSAMVASSAHAFEDQAFVDAISCFADDC
jgi:hypothetical protein